MQTLHPALIRTVALLGGLILLASCGSSSDAETAAPESTTSIAATSDSTEPDDSAEAEPAAEEPDTGTDEETADDETQEEEKEETDSAGTEEEVPLRETVAISCQLVPIEDAVAEMQPVFDEFCTWDATDDRLDVAGFHEINRPAADGSIVAVTEVGARTGQCDAEGACVMRGVRLGVDGLDGWVVEEAISVQLDGATGVVAGEMELTAWPIGAEGAPTVETVTAIATDGCFADPTTEGWVEERQTWEYLEVCPMTSDDARLADFESRHWIGVEDPYVFPHDVGTGVLGASSPIEGELVCGGDNVCRGRSTFLGDGGIDGYVVLETTYAEIVSPEIPAQPEITYTLLELR